MKIATVSADADGNINPMIGQGLLDFLPNHVDSQSQADAVIVPIAYSGGYRFNRELLRINKPVLLMDFLEFGWSAGDRENRLGHNALQQFGHLASHEWAMLDAWIAQHPPKFTFKRELLERDRSKTMLPIEWPCRLPAPPLQSREEFSARPMEVFSSWGLSHPSRPRLHGDIFRNAHNCGIHVIDGWDQDGHFDGRTWATIHTPHYNRKPIEEVMRWQHRAKISVSLPGAGVKCFRSAEAPVGSIMAMLDDELAWSIPWNDGDNCIRLVSGFMFDELNCAALTDDLYGTYLRSQETIDRYRSERYVAEYVIPSIEDTL